MRRLILLTLMLCCVLLPSQANEGRGLIRQGVINDLDTQFTSFNPLLCADEACFRVLDFLFPTLLGTDYESHWFTAGTAENNALAADWTISDDGRVYLFQLREDAFWSDGTPITAYDYLYTFLAIKGNFASNYVYAENSIRDSIAGVVPLGEYELAVILKEADCDALANMDFYVVPAHVFAENFSITAREFFADTNDIEAAWSAWDEAFDYDFSFMLDHPFNAAPIVTGGDFRFVDWDQRQHIRLEQGNIAYELVPVSSQTEMVDRFLSGDLNVLPFVPTERIPDFASNPDVQLLQSNTPIYDYIAFNLADPLEPMSAFDEDGNPLEQGVHPILGNINIRRAIQLGIDRQNLIDIALNGQGQISSAILPPLSWAYTADEAATFDPDEAERLLEEAGWVRVAGRTIRECIGCETVPDGTSLVLSLAYAWRVQHQIAAINLQQQLRRIGIDLSIFPSNLGEISIQRFDLYLASWFYSYPSAPSLEQLFAPEADIVGQGWNIASYNNPDVTALINDAKSVAGCDLAEAQTSYAEIQTMLSDDLPYIWLYSEIATHAYSADIQHVMLQPEAPFWNIGDWVVFDAP